MVVIKMNLLNYILLITIVVCIVFIWFFSIYNYFRYYTIRLNDAQNRIEASLKKICDLLYKSTDILMSCENSPDTVLVNISEIKTQKIDNFDFEKQIILGIEEFYSYLKSIPEIIKNEEYIKIGKEIEKSEIELEAFKKYYNELAVNYNLDIKKATKFIVAKIGGFKAVKCFE